MNIKIVLSFLLLSVFSTLINAAEKADNVFDEIKIDEICTTDSCKSAIKNLEEKNKHMKPGALAEHVLKYVQREFGHTTNEIREHMQKQSTPQDIKKALSHCLKMYLDIAHELRGAFLAIKTKKYGPDATEFSGMAKRFPGLCEHGLVKAKTSGEKLGLYSNSYNHNDLTDMGNALDVIVRFAASHKKE